MNISTDTLLELKCCECECYLSRTPIYVGEDGSAICGRCPIPNPEDSKNSGHQMPAYYRMIPYENLIKEIPFPCMYQNNGCAIKITSKDLRNHEENCNHRPYVCPMMSSGRCDWIGRKEKLIEHCQTQHVDRLLEHPCVFKHNYTMNSSEPYVTIISDTLFLVNAKVCLTTNKINYSVNCFGDVANIFSMNFKLVIERECDKIIKNGKIVPFAQKNTEKNVFVSCSIHSLVEILNGSDKTTFTIQIDIINKCIYCNSFNETINKNGFCEMCNSKRVTCISCSFKDIEIKAIMHKCNFCKFSKWCWVCNTRLIDVCDKKHYDENHRDVIHLECNFWKISKNDFKRVYDNVIIDFIIDSKYDRFFGAIVQELDGYSFRICTSTLPSEEASKLTCRISIQNNSNDDKKLLLNYDFQSKYDWNIVVSKNDIFLNNTSSQIKIDFIKKVFV